MSNIKYRPNVAAILRRADGCILVAERRDIAGAWQFPQGGVDRGENLLQALKREIREELGLLPEHYEIGEMHGPYRYVFPGTRSKWGCQGQEQHYFLLHTHPESQPTIDVPHPEFRSLQWIQPPDFQLSWLPEMKKDVYRQVFRDFFGVTIS